MPQKMSSEPARITFDDALTHYIGEFGRGQRQLVAILSLFGISNGFVLLLWVMVTIDPVKALQWRCTDPGDLSCSAVHAASNSYTSPAFCQLPAGSWHWTSTGDLMRLLFSCLVAVGVQTAAYYDRVLQAAVRGVHAHRQLLITLLCLAVLHCLLVVWLSCL